MLATWEDNGFDTSNKYMEERFGVQLLEINKPIVDKLFELLNGKVDFYVNSSDTVSVYLKRDNVSEVDITFGNFLINSCHIHFKQGDVDRRAFNRKIKEFGLDYVGDYFAIDGKKRFNYSFLITNDVEMEKIINLSKSFIW